MKLGELSYKHIAEHGHVFSSANPPRRSDYEAASIVIVVVVSLSSESGSGKYSMYIVASTTV